MCLEDFGQIILHGPPGTGKTYEARHIAARMLEFDEPAGAFEQCQLDAADAPADRGRWAIVQFHPSYNYEDFVRGISGVAAPAGVAFEVQNRIFARMCEKARDTPAQKFVLIIDEINRANLAAVFGELLFALEYRNTPVRLPYAIGDHHSLTVPQNLYLIGTMNTADRSIGHLDYALRRRFAFLPLAPRRDVINNFHQEAHIRDLALQMFDDVSGLFVGNQNMLSPDHRPEDVQVGHTYFLHDNELRLQREFHYKVLPLLHEYLADGVLRSEAKLRIDALVDQFPPVG